MHTEATHHVRLGPVCTNRDAETLAHAQATRNISRWQLACWFPEAKWVTLDMPRVRVFGEAITELKRLYHLELRCPSFEGNYKKVMMANSSLARMVVQTAQGGMLAFSTDRVSNLELLRHWAGAKYFSAMVRACWSCCEACHLPFACDSVVAIWTGR